MESCKFCGSKNLRKNGLNRKKQRYFCKDCQRSQVEGDDRKKHPEFMRNAAVAMYLEGCGFRRIARLLEKIYSIHINFQLVFHWIRNIGKKVEIAASNKVEAKEIAVLELDELYTYIQKKQIKSECGLLLIETGCVLVRLK
jgi:transposase-like protein